MNFLYTDLYVIVVMKVIIEDVQVPHDTTMSVPKPRFPDLGSPVAQCLVKPAYVGTPEPPDTFKVSLRIL